jgi:hypothetical protein
MRSIFYGGAIFAALVAGSFSASAQGAQGGGNNRFCAEMKNPTGAGLQCQYKTMAQCQEAVKGNQGTCIENPKMKKGM